MRVQKYRRLDEVRDFSRTVSGNELQLKESRRRWQCKIVNNAQQFEILPTPEYRSSELKQSLKTYPLLACNRRGHALFPTRFLFRNVQVEFAGYRRSCDRSELRVRQCPISHFYRQADIRHTVHFDAPFGIQSPKRHFGQKID